MRYFVRFRGVFRESTYHGQVPLPRSAAGPVADRAGALQSVAPALAAIQGHVAIGPGDAAAEAAVELVAQLLDGHDGLRVHLGAPTRVGDVVQAVAQGGQRAGREICGNSRKSRLCQNNKNKYKTCVE